MPDNGISEAFVKTLKRDYVRVTILPDAHTVMALLPDWFEDLYEVAPVTSRLLALSTRIWRNSSS